jgi:hypothetical protein
MSVDFVAFEGVVLELGAGLIESSWTVGGVLSSPFTGMGAVGVVAKGLFGVVADELLVLHD